MFSWDAGELFFMGMPDRTQNVTTLVVSAMLERLNAGTTEPEMAVSLPEQLSRMSLSKKLDLFRTT